MITKVTKNNGILQAGLIHRDIAKKLITENHYSKTWNTSFGIMNYGLFQNDRLLGVAVYGNLMNPDSRKNISDDSDSVIELNRLWIDDCLGKNSETTFLSMTFKMLKSTTGYKHIQSFADGRLGCGTIYKAANFLYYGYSSSIFFENEVTKDVYHKVTLENTKRPTSMLSRNRLFLDGSLKSFRVKTYRYIYDLYPKKHSCKLNPIEYPSYSIGTEEFSENVFSKDHLARLANMYLSSGDQKYHDKAFEKGTELFGESFLTSYKKLANDVPTLEQFMEN